MQNKDKFYFENWVVHYQFNQFETSYRSENTIVKVTVILRLQNKLWFMISLVIMLTDVKLHASGIIWIKKALYQHFFTCMLKKSWLARQRGLKRYFPKFCHLIAQNSTMCTFYTILRMWCLLCFFKGCCGWWVGWHVCKLNYHNKSMHKM